MGLLWLYRLHFIPVGGTWLTQELINKLCYKYECHNIILKTYVVSDTCSKAKDYRTSVYGVAMGNVFIICDQM